MLQCTAGGRHWQPSTTTDANRHRYRVTVSDGIHQYTLWSLLCARQRACVVLWSSHQLYGYDSVFLTCMPCAVLKTRYICPASSRTITRLKTHLFHKSFPPQSASTHLDYLLGLYWTGLLCSTVFHF